MKANYKRKNSEGVYVKHQKDKPQKLVNAREKQNVKKNNLRISRKGIQ